MIERKFWLFGIALIVASCSPSVGDRVIPPLPELRASDADNVQYFDPRADILFVIDSSGSMSTHQQNLAANSTRFTTELGSRGQLNYQIAVITTDGPGDFKGKPKFVTPLTPNGSATLATRMQVGTNGHWEEKSFDPVAKALDPEKLRGEHQGFIRDEAHLAVIFITDAEDQSTVETADSLLQKLVTLKRGNSARVLGYGAIVPSGDNSCSRDGMESPTRIEEFLGKVKNGSQGQNIFNLCAVDFGDRLAGIADDIAREAGRTILLTRRPDLNTIKVFLGSSELPKDAKIGWSYSPSRNALILGDEIDWAQVPVGSKIKVTYEAI